MHRIPASLGCHDGHEQEPIELTNGWMWNNRYYATIEALNSDFYQRIHIGKSSSGWRFGLCTYPTENPKFKDGKTGYHEYYLDKPISSFDDWVELFNDPNNHIENGCGEEITKDKMIDIIAHRKPCGELLEGWHKVNVGTQSESKEEYFFIHGLMAHKMSRPHPSWMDVDADKYEKNNTIMPEDCTYDLIVSGNDIDNCEIFS